MRACFEHLFAAPAARPDSILPAFFCAPLRGWDFWGQLVVFGDIDFGSPQTTGIAACRGVALPTASSERKCGFGTRGSGGNGPQRTRCFPQRCRMHDDANARLALGNRLQELARVSQDAPTLVAYLVRHVLHGRSNFDVTSRSAGFARRYLGICCRCRREGISQAPSRRLAYTGRRRSRRRRPATGDAARSAIRSFRGHLRAHLSSAWQAAAEASLRERGFQAAYFPRDGATRACAGAPSLNRKRSGLCPPCPSGELGPEHGRAPPYLPRLPMAWQ